MDDLLTIVVNRLRRRLYEVYQYNDLGYLVLPVPISPSDYLLVHLHISVELHDLDLVAAVDSVPEIGRAAVEAYLHGENAKCTDTLWIYEKGIVTAFSALDWCDEFDAPTAILLAIQRFESALLEQREAIRQMVEEEHARIAALTKP